MHTGKLRFWLVLFVMGLLFLGCTQAPNSNTATGAQATNETTGTTGSTTANGVSKEGTNIREYNTPTNIPQEIELKLTQDVFYTNQEYEGVSLEVSNRGMQNVHIAASEKCKGDYFKVLNAQGRELQLYPSEETFCAPAVFFTIPTQTTFEVSVWDNLEYYTEVTKEYVKAGPGIYKIIFPKMISLDMDTSLIELTEKTLYGLPDSAFTSKEFTIQIKEGTEPTSE